MVTSSSSANNFDSSLTSIYNRLNTLETNISCLKEGYSQIREHFDYVPINYEASNIIPTVKVAINGENLRASCDIMSEFCLMPKEIYESLGLWGLSEGGEEIHLTNNTTIFPIGIAERVFYKTLRKNSLHYLVIGCVGGGKLPLEDLC